MLTRYPILTRPKNSFTMFDEFDKLAGDMFKKTENYPPFNIYSLDNDSTFIEMSVLGFDKDEISVELNTDEGELVVTGTHKETDEDAELKKEKKYSHRGLSMKNFTRTFTVNANLEVNDIIMENGLLTISFIRKEKKTISYQIS